MTGAVHAKPGRWASPGRRSPAELHHDPVPSRPRSRGALTLVVLLSALTWGVFAVLDLGNYRETADLSSLNDIVDTSTMLLAAVVGVLALLQWRLGQDRDDLFLGIGLLVFGLATIGFDNLLVPRLPDAVQEKTLVMTVAPLGFVIALGFLAAPVVRPRLPWLRLVHVLVVLAGVGALLWFLPTLAEVVAGRRDGSVTGGMESGGQLVVVALMVAVGVAYWTNAHRENRTFHAWMGLTLLAVAQSRVALALSSGGALWLAGSRIFRLEALFFALMGINRELHEGFTRQQTELRTSMARVRSMETQREAEQAALEERRHDVRSALFAIGGVAELLGRSHEELDAGTLEALTQAMGAEVARLRELVAEQEREECAPFSLLETVSPLVLMERSNGLDVTCNVSQRLVAVGRPKETAQVLRNLLDNARTYAPGSPVVVRGEERDEWVVLLVEDRGPGIPAAERRTVFDRARRGSTAEGTQGSGLGLYVASRLMREQGGDLWVTERAGGGASFVLSLPVHQPESSPPPKSRGRPSR